MDNNVPNGISFKDLQDLQEKAAEKESDASDKHLSFEQIVEAAAKAKDDLLKETQTPLAHKMLVLMILQSMYEWHEGMALEMREHGLSVAADGWLLDAGQLQMISKSFQDIEITEQDPTPRWKES